MSDPNSVSATRPEGNGSEENGSDEKGSYKNGAEENGAQDSAPELPLTLLDEALLHLQNARSQWNVQLELGTGHHVDEDAFRKAVLATCRRHPLTRARIAPWKKTDNSYQWNVVDDLDIDPIRVADCPDDATLARLRAELYTPPIDLDVAPGLRIALARRAQGDLVLLSASHIVADGVGVVRLMQSIGRAYRGEPDPPDPLPLAEARDLGSFLAPKTRNEKWARNWEALRRLREAFDSPSRIAVVGGTDSEEFGFVFRTLDVGDTTTPGLLNRKSGTTINDVLLAALHLTVQIWNTRYDMSTNRVGVMMPVNVRPSDRFWEVVSNITSMVTVSTSSDDRTDLETATAAVAEQTTQVRREDRAYGLYDILDATRMTPLPIKRVAPKLLPHTGDRFVDTAMLSNLGRLPETPAMDPPDSGGRPSELWFSPPCDPTCSVAIGIITSGRHLSLVTRYRNEQFDTEAAEEFTDLLISQFTRQNDSAGA